MQHYSWDAIPEELLGPGLSRRYVTGEKAMAAQISLRKGTVTPVHQHDAEQICYVLSGALRFQIEGKEQTVSAGQGLVIPSNVPHGAEALEDTIALDVFSPIRYDWLNKTDDYLRKDK